MTLYTLKPRFQDLLRPVIATLARSGVTPNAVTIAAALGSVLVGALTWSHAESRVVFLITPAWLLVRMALNAADGALARERHLTSALGAYLNEIGDVLSDAALYAPFARVLPAAASSIAIVIALSFLAELAGALGPSIGASRRYDGPMGKSDRALVFGAFGVWVGVSRSTPLALGWTMPVISVLLGVTIVNRVRAGVDESERAGGQRC